MNAPKKIKSEFVKVAIRSRRSWQILSKQLFVDDFIRTIPSGQSKISFTGKGEGSRVGQATTRTSSNNDEQSN